MNNENNDHHEQWYSVDKDESDNKKIEKRIEDLEKTTKDDLEKNTKRIEDLEKYVKEIENHLQYLTNNNLKLINRLLEAEISLERAKNSLVRNHIPFPFSSTLLTRKFI